MVIELLEGCDLAAELTRRLKLDVPVAVDLIVQACSAMADAHALGVIHRDLKPANLFLIGKGPSKTVKVLDFGISKVFDDEGIGVTTTPSLTLGTPHYMSPEQILASKDVDGRSDIWSLGVILYKSIAGCFPFEADSTTALVVSVATTTPAPIEQHAEVPPGFSAALMRSLSRKREDRYATVDDFAKAIEPFGSGRVSFVPATKESVPPAPDPSSDVVTLGARQPTPIPVHVATEANWTESRVPGNLARRRPLLVVGGAAVGVIGAILAAIAGLGRGTHETLPASLAASPPPPVTTAPDQPLRAEPAPTASAATIAISATAPASARPASTAATRAPGSLRAAAASARAATSKETRAPASHPAAPSPAKDPLHL